MQRLVKPLAVVLAVPLLCAAIALTARQRLDDRWQAGLRREFVVRRQPVNEGLIARYSLSALCGDPRTAAAIRPCRPYGLFTAVGTASLGVAALGLLFLATIALAGRACRANPRLLPRLFAPALHLTIGALVLLVFLHGALAFAGFYLLGQAIERWPVFIVLAVALAALLAALSMIQVALALARKASAPIVARILDPASQPRLAAAVAQVAAALGSDVPDRFVAGLGPGLFVTQAEVVTLDGPARGRSMYLSLALARILSVDELRGLLAHELAHFSGNDRALAVRFYPVFAGAARGIRALEQRARGLRWFVFLPALSVLSFFLRSFVSPGTDMGHDRELAADQAAAHVVDPAVFAAALLKAHAFSPAWTSVLDAMERAVAEGTQYTNASELFAQVVAGNSMPERLSGIGRLALRHPTDDLPALGIRLGALGLEPAGLTAAALATRPSPAAISLVDGADAVERDLSQVEHRLLALRAEHADRAV